MATRKTRGGEDKPRSPFGDISRDNPRMLERVSDGARARATDPVEFMSLTTGHGYRDVTGESSKRSGSSNAGSGSGATPAADNTASK